MKSDKERLNEFIELLAQSAKLDFNKKNRLIITLEGIDQKQFLSISALLKSVVDGNATQAQDEYVSFVQQVVSNPLYKPKNPSLAIVQIAKRHGLEVAKLQQAVKKLIHN
ncbi:MAG: hypothetical protein HRU20_02285 [Pseudomonadales bacterium]|nr:hypothetical protein [Pseudomonadales bacterium]